MTNWWFQLGIGVFQNYQLVILTPIVDFEEKNNPQFKITNCSAVVYAHLCPPKLYVHLYMCLFVIPNMYVHSNLLSNSCVRPYRFSFVLGTLYGNSISLPLYSIPRKLSSMAWDKLRDHSGITLSVWLESGSTKVMRLCLQVFKMVILVIK